MDARGKGRVRETEYKKNDILKGLEVRALSSEGAGIAKIEGYPLFIKDALPGDTVTVKLTKVKKDMAFARLLEIQSESVDRVRARCDMSRPCGGCAIQELSYEKQLEFKDEKVYNCLLRIGGIPAKVLDEAHESPIGMEKPWRYRNKAQFPIGRDRDGRIVSGFFAGRTHHIVEAKDCYLNPPEFSTILRTFLNFCEESQIEPYDEEKNTGCIRHLIVRKAFGTGELMTVPVIRSFRDFDEKKIRRLKESLDGIPGLASIVLNENPDRTNVISGKEYRVISGQGYIMDQMGDLRFRISPSSFYQVNTAQAERIYEKALAYAGINGGERVYDLCCGIGTISLFLAKKAGQVTGIEVSERAVEDARLNAELNGITNAEFIAAAVEEYLPKQHDIRVDVAVLDPPRSGVERPVLDTIVKAEPSRIVYISCDPATQARDIKVFLAAGYGLKRYVAIDQFCHTFHVENVCLLTRK